MQTKTENNGSPTQRLQAKEGETANTCSESLNIKECSVRACEHPFCGCISSRGYLCNHKEPCEPVDYEGNLISISHFEEESQILTVKSLKAPVTDAEAVQADMWSIPASTKNSSGVIIA